MKPDATAFAQRAAQHNMFVFTSWEDPAQSDAVGSWARAAWKKLEPHTHGFYVNEFNDDVRRACATPTARTTTGWWHSRRSST